MESKLYALSVPDQTSGLAAAISIAQTILSVAKARSWIDLDGTIPATVALTGDQVDLLVEHQAIIGYLRAPVAKTKTTEPVPGVTLCVCSSCGKWLMVATGTASIPSRCQLTTGCDGAPSRVGAATKRPIGVVDDPDDTQQPLTPPPSQPPPVLDERADAEPVLGDETLNPWACSEF